ncbi:MAG: adenylate kinase [Armatimonadota bacterium]
MRVILIGPPGVGKGTQAALLGGRKGVPSLSSGEIFRREIEAQTDLGRMAQRYISHGELVPNGVTIEMMAKRLRDPEIRRSGFILDGFPRTVRQADSLQEILTDLDLPLQRVYSLYAPDELIVSRLSGRMGCTKCGAIYHSLSKPTTREGYCDVCNSPIVVRSDDQPDTIRERLRIFREETAPVIEFYEELGLTRVIDASRDAEEVYKDIISELE